MIVDVDTIASFLNVDAEKVQRNAKTLIKKARGKFEGAVPAPLRGEAGISMLGAAESLLESPMASILGDAWKTSKDLDRFCDQSAYPPDKLSEYTLAEHEIALKRQPEIELVLNGVPMGLTLQFELKLALTVMSAVLRIQAGRIIGARVAEFRGSGKYSCSSVTLAERKTGKFRIPGEIAFNPGIALGKAYG